MTPADEFVGQKNRDILIANAINLKNLTNNFGRLEKSFTKFKDNDFKDEQTERKKNTAYRNYMLGIGSVIAILLSYGVFFIR